MNSWCMVITRGLGMQFMYVCMYFIDTCVQQKEKQFEMAINSWEQEKHQFSYMLPRI